MHFISKADAPYYVFESFKNFRNIIHFVSTRHGGVSDGAFASLNLGLGTEDRPLSVLQNRQLLSDSVGISQDNFVMASQVHGTSVAVVSQEMKGAGAFSRHNAIPATDAMVTNEKEICLMVLAADCVPILFFDPVKKAIGAAHAGWRGTVDQIAIATVKKMQEAYASSLSDIHVAIGPSIGPCCYKVGGEVIEAVLNTFGKTDGLINFENSESAPMLDLWASNKMELIDLGIPEGNIEIAGMCTHCHHQDFYSSRYAKGLTGRFGAGIMLK